jgi:RNA polymerase sigma-70 factor, ECF subfamily
MAAAGEPLVLQPSALSNSFGTESTERDDGLSTFFTMRSNLFGIAYHMLGNAAEADDIVQDAWLRWQSTNRALVDDPPAFLATTTMRLCINLVRAARFRRETHIEPRFADPVDPSCDPESFAQRGEALRNALLILLETLSPTERAAYILREAFDYPYRQIADILGMEEGNTRQLVFRARKHIADGRRTPVSSDQQRHLFQAFTSAAQTGEMAALEGLLANDVHSPTFDPETTERCELELQRISSQVGQRVPRKSMGLHGDHGSKSHALQAGAVDAFAKFESIAPFAIAIRRAQNAENARVNWEEL